MTPPVAASNSQSTRWTFAGVMGLFALQWVWHAALFPPSPSHGLWLATGFSLPLALLAIGLWLRRRSARYWSGVFALVYFCHGIAEAWTFPAERGLALAEAGLSVAVILAANWPGLAAKLKGRAAPPPNV